MHNRLGLAEECLHLGRAAEAIGLFEACAAELHANDPAIRLGLARARFAAGDSTGAVAELEALRRDTPDARSAEGHLLYARALDGAGRTAEAREEYETLVAYFPEEEARLHYAELLTRLGIAGRAAEQYREIVRRVDLQGANYRRMQRPWYDAARRALSREGR